MKSIKIYGASDDLVEIEGDCKGCDEYGAVGSGPLMGVITLKSGDDSIKVFCVYDGSWAFAVCPQSGDYERMPWETSFAFGVDVGYSQTIDMLVPDDCEVSFSPQIKGGTK